MAHAQVDVTEDVSLEPAACWSILRGFCNPWHPFIEKMQSEANGKIRAFTVKGEPTLYKERMTWISDSDRALRYTALQGIEGAKRYDAEVSVAASVRGDSKIRWQADIEAEHGRAEEIAQGTEAVFRAGIAALANASVPQPKPTSVSETKLSPRQVQTSPKLEVLSSEPTDTPLCLFLHGIGGQKENWTAQLHAVSPILQTAALDLRGYGGSALGSEPSTVEDYCNDILAVCTAFNTSKVILCGLSYGAWIATSFAMRHPDMLHGLVLAGGCTGMSEADTATRTAFRESRELPLSLGQTPADFASAVIDVIAGPAAPAAVRTALTASMSAIPVDTYRDALHCFTNPGEKFDFSHLSMPVLMMTGSHDRLAPPTEIRGVAGRIWTEAPHPDVRFEEIADAGHVCNLEQPETFNRVLLEFLDGLET